MGGVTRGPCVICRRPDAEQINDALRSGVSVRKVAQAFSAPKSTVGEHRRECLSVDPSAARPDASVDMPDIQVISPLGRVDGGSPFLVENPEDDPPTAPRKVVTALVEQKAVAMRAAGKTYRDIGAELGIDEETASDCVERVLIRTAKATDAKADAARALDLERIERLIAGLWDRATSGTFQGEDGYDPSQDKAVERVTKLLERRAKLLGIEAQTGPSTVVNVLSVASHPHFEAFMKVVLGALEDAPEAKEKVIRAVMVEIETRRTKRAA